MEHYLKERSLSFNAWSEFSCQEECERMGCKEPNLHISISLVDLMAISLNSGQRASQLFKKDIKIGFNPLSGKGPWAGRLSLELKKPCHFRRLKPAATKLRLQNFDTNLCYRSSPLLRYFWSDLLIPAFPGNDRPGVNSFAFCFQRNNPCSFGLNVVTMHKPFTILRRCGDGTL